MLEDGRTLQVQYKEIAINEGVSLKDVTRVLNFPRVAELVKTILAHFPKSAVTTYGDLATAVGSVPSAVTKVVLATDVSADHAAVVIHAKGRGVFIEDDTEFTPNDPDTLRSNVLGQREVKFRLSGGYLYIDPNDIMVLTSDDLREILFANWQMPHSFSKAPSTDQTALAL
ncbi:hypothetical protein [Arthrobacter sp. HLT1-20]